MDIGVSKSSGITCYRGLRQNLTLAFFAREGGGTRVNPQQMIKQIVEMRSLESNRTLSLERKFVLIVEGGRAYLERWQGTNFPVELRIFVGARSDLDALGIDVIDASWRPEDNPINLNDYVSRINLI